MTLAMRNEAFYLAVDLVGMMEVRQQLWGCKPPYTTKAIALRQRLSALEPPFNAEAAQLRQGDVRPEFFALARQISVAIKQLDAAYATAGRREAASHEK